MNHYRQHVPGCVDADPQEFDFETTEELLAHPLVNRDRGPDFSHYALSGDALIAVFKNGFEWWCLGFIKHPEAIQVPKWDGGRYLGIIAGRPYMIRGTDVVRTCGNEIVLKDGTVAEWVWP